MRLCRDMCCQLLGPHLAASGALKAFGCIVDTSPLLLSHNMRAKLVFLISFNCTAHQPKATVKKVKRYRVEHIFLEILKEAIISIYTQGKRISLRANVVEEAIVVLGDGELPGHDAESSGTEERSVYWTGGLCQTSNVQVNVVHRVVSVLQTVNRLRNLKRKINCLK